MAFKNPFKDISTENILVFVVAFFILIQAISWLISSLFKDVPMLKTGPILIFISAGLGLLLLTKGVFSRELSKMQLFMFILIVGIAVALYIYGPQVVPQIFSIFGDSAVQSANNLQSMIGLP